MNNSVQPIESKSCTLIRSYRGEEIFLPAPERRLVNLSPSPREKALIPFITPEGNPNAESYFTDKHGWAEKMDMIIDIAYRAMVSQETSEIEKGIQAYYNELIIYEANVGEPFPTYVHSHYQALLSNFPKIPSYHTWWDFFAYHHRKHYASIDYALTGDPAHLDWSKTSFGINPFCIPRVRLWGEVHKSNHTRVELPQYSSYSKLAARYYSTRIPESGLTYNPFTDSWFIQEGSDHYILPGRNKKRFSRTDSGYFVEQSPVEDTYLTIGTPTLWFHPSPENVWKNWRIMNNIFDRIRIPSTGKPETIENFRGIKGPNGYLAFYIDMPNDILGQHLAQLSWWSSQVMPLRRGSSAVNDMMQELMGRFFNLKKHKVKKGVARDLEALVTPKLTQYMANWEHMHC